MSEEVKEGKSISLGTDVQTESKQINTASVETQEMASQVQKEVKEAFCDGSIQTVSRGSQSRADMSSQEINCQILRPEQQEESIEDEEAIVCFRCDGTKVNKKGLPCRRCNGSGSLNNRFFQDLMKVLREEIKSFTTQTFQRLMVEYLSKKSADQALEEHKGITCDGCNVTSMTGIRYKCSVCPDFDLCDKCEASNTHAHPFLKIRRHDQAPQFISCQYQY
jgi:hypothetical protein